MSGEYTPTYPSFYPLKIIENKFGSLNFYSYLCSVDIKQPTGWRENKSPEEYTPTCPDLCKLSIYKILKKNIKIFVNVIFYSYLCIGYISLSCDRYIPVSHHQRSCVLNSKSIVEDNLRSKV